MIIEGYRLKESDTPCPYLSNCVFTSENLIIKNIDCDGMGAMLESGYRHFGNFFFRPACSNCSECCSLRIPVQKFSFSGSEKRVIKKAEHLIVNIIESPEPKVEYFNLYKAHKRRFREAGIETLDNWTSSFFTDQAFSRILEIRDETALIAVTHLDVTPGAVSAVYCYWNDAYAHLSPGKLSILHGLKLAITTEAEYYYLGYYIKDNSHMSYKAAYRPNQILKDTIWLDYK